MATLREEALTYESKETKNIADVDFFPANLDLKEFEGKTKEGKDFSYKYVVIDGEEYRVPLTVLKDMKAILEEEPSTEYFKVKKQGEGMNTKYTTMAHTPKGKK